MHAQIIDRRFVVGMTWQQTVQAVDLKRHAPQLARKARASYYCTVAPTTIGTAKLKVRSRGEKLIALAAGVATLGNGQVFVALRLASGGIWICGSIDHAPAAGFDQVVSDQASAQAFFEQFATQAYGQIEVYCSESNLLVTVEQVDTITFADIVRAAADSEPLAKAGISIPLPYAYVVGASLVVLAGMRVWDYWQAEQRRHAELLASANAIDPKTAWTEAYAAHAQQQIIYDHTSLRAIREAIESPATSLAGWRLKRTDCVPASEKWACTMEFERMTDVGLDPTNSEFERLRPRHWYNVRFPNINLASAVMDVDTGMTKLDFQALPSLAVQQVEGISALQERLRAFASHSVDPFKEEQITAPLNKSGEAIPKPAELRLALYKAELKDISGPLRSVDLFVAADVPVAWTKFSVAFDRLSPDWLDKGEATLTKSAMTATLTGEIYAKD